MLHYDGQLAKTDCAACPIRHRAVCASCAPPELARLEAIKSYRTVRAGEIVAMEGGALDFVASVVTGCATLTRSLEDGRTQMVGLLMPGDFVGRPGRDTAPYEVTAATDAVLCRFARRPFERLLEELPSLRARLLEMSLDELDAARDWMLLLGRKTAREKVASLLMIVMRRAAHGGSPPRAELPLTREAMASYLGLTIETVSRQMTALRKDGVIVLQGQRGLTCRDLGALAAEAGMDEAA